VTAISPDIVSDIMSVADDKKPGPEGPLVLPSADVPMLAGWGRAFRPGREVLTEDLETATRNATLSRGLGRSYGDSALPPPGVLDVVTTPLADRILAFDAETGRLRAEAGLSLRDLVQTFLPRGWFPPVTPGTWYVTLGGMVAADVHGKNHHVAGCIGEHVTSLRMRTADGEIRTCSPDEHTDLFDATLGGMGLTGHILEVEIQLERVPSPWILQETERFDGLEAFMTGLTAASAVWPYTVGWIDCLARGDKMGRGVLYSGRWATAEEAPGPIPPWRRTVTVPFQLPSWLINDFTMSVAASLIYLKQWRRKQVDLVSAETFFYPLDRIRQWNLAYGNRGMTQYQCVLPREGLPDSARRFMEIVTARRGVSFLCVMKDCGAEGRGTLSFPMPGMSIALDMPLREHTQDLVDALNEQVLADGGRIYLAKDSLSRPEHFQAMDKRLGRWLQVRDSWDPDRRLRSAQSVRLLDDPVTAGGGK